MARAQLGLLLALLASVAQALNNGVGQTPAMGWNSWNYFRCNINETIIKEVTDAIVTSGLRDAGYQYVNIDDCWMEKRGQDGRIIPFKDKFPSGMKALADYIHSKGLKFGVYSDTGNHTCEGYPGSWGYEKLDAQTYAEWGVDYLKYDYCGMDKAGESVQQSYERMRDALNATGRPILYSLCSWGSGSPWLWGKNVGNSWRTGIDLFAVWDADQARKLKLPNFLQPVLSAIKAVEEWHEYAGPGSFNDPDMLVVGLDGMYPYGIVAECPEHVKGCKPGEYISRERWGKVGGLTHTEQKTAFAFWCMLASPLILGNDPRAMTQATLSILTAPEIIAINQDPLAKQARKVWIQGELSIWVKPLEGGRVAALLFNMGSAAAEITLNYTRDLPDLAAKWARDVPGADPVCVDSLEGCKGWAKSGECEKNPGFMLDKCHASCPAACPHPLGDPGPKATALVRDAWQRDDLGTHVALFKAHLVEPHEARVLVLTFMEPGDAAEWAAQRKASRLHGDSSAAHKLAVGQVITDTTRRELHREVAVTTTAPTAREEQLQAQVARLLLDVQDNKVKLESSQRRVRELEEQLEEAEAAAERLNEGANLGEDADEEVSGDGAAGVGPARQTPLWLLPVIGLVVGSNLLTLLLTASMRPRVPHKPSVHLN